jgi:hypothetical protein
MARSRDASDVRRVPLICRSPDVLKDSTMSNTLYDQDFYAWANEQAALLRAGKLEAADIEHIAEEIESMGRSEKRELINRLTVLLIHLLKWRYQPALRSGSWRLTIEEQRYRLEDHLADNPSLKAQLDRVMHDAYRRARLGAERETGLLRTAFPEVCPFSFDEAIRGDFWPD